jgi:hypothetical protein
MSTIIKQFERKLDELRVIHNEYRKLDDLLKKIKDELDEYTDNIYVEYTKLLGESRRLHKEGLDTDEIDLEIITASNIIDKSYDTWDLINDMNDSVLDYLIQLCDNMDKYLFTLNKSICKTNYITKNKGKEISSNMCSVCLDTHDAKHIVKTSCGHYFGKPCFATLIKQKFKFGKFESHHVKCPYCRSNVVTLCQFKYKKQN